jgi:GTP-binding protein Era
MDEPVSSRRCGLVAVVGLPNAGKSTLVNALVGQKITIVSHKVQTTRNRVMGIALSQGSQIVLMDTPGILKDPQKRLERAMVQAAWDAPRDGDVTLFIVDAQHPETGRHLGILENLQGLKTPLWVVLNKIDKVKRPTLLAQASAFQNYSFVDKVFMISALKEDGTQDILQALAQAVPSGPWLFPEEDVATAPERLLAAEITRETIFRFLHAELPYTSYVETEHWEVFRNGNVKISQSIHVLKESQKAIVLGNKGHQIKLLSTRARQALEHTLGVPVHLFLQVKVTPDWMERPSFYNTMGLRFDA